MKICYLADVNNYHTKKWCKYFVSKGHNVIVISLTKGNIEGCKCYSFEFENVKYLNSFQKLSYLTVVKKVKSILNREKPDLLHSHYASSYGFIGVLTGYKPFITSLWGTDVYSFPQKSIVHKYVLKKVLNTSDYLFSTSNCMAQEGNKYTSKKMLITPFGVDTQMFSPKPNKKNDTLVIGINKSLEKIYGLDILLKSYAEFANKNTDILSELRIAGKGSQYKYLRDLSSSLGIEEKVKFYGYLEENQMVEFLQNLDFAVFPSYYESFGVSALEAQACGVPVIVSDADGFMESTIPDKTSLVFEKGNVVQLNGLIQKLSCNEKLRIEMGNAGREFVLERFDLQLNFSNIEKIYDEILEKKKK